MFHIYNSKWYHYHANIIFFIFIDILTIWYLYCFCQAGKQGGPCHFVLQAGDGKFWTNPKHHNTRLPPFLCNYSMIELSSFDVNSGSWRLFPFFLSESDLKVTLSKWQLQTKIRKWCMPIPCRLSVTPFKPSTPISWEIWYGMICSQGQVRCGFVNTWWIISVFIDSNESTWVE